RRRAGRRDDLGDRGVRPVNGRMVTSSADARATRRKQRLDDPAGVRVAGRLRFLRTSQTVLSNVPAYAFRGEPMKKRSLIRQAVATGGAALVLASSTLGVTAYNYLKPTAAGSAPIASVALAAPQTSSGTVYQLRSSQARFIVDEVLRGSPFTVVGAT